LTSPVKIVARRWTEGVSAGNACAEIVVELAALKPDLIVVGLLVSFCGKCADVASMVVSNIHASLLPRRGAAPVVAAF
jgi:methionyl-tRNA formyltransferase